MTVTDPARVPLPLPPAPRLPRAAQTALYFRDPPAFLERCRRRFGPVFRVRFVAAPRLVYVAEPELARRVFQTDRDIGRAGAVRRDFLAPLVGEHSLLCLDGEAWLRQRRLLAPAFHGPAVEGFAREIAAIAAAEIEAWPLGEALELRPRMQAITLEVILRVVFGIRDASRLARLRELLPPLLEGRAWLALWVLPQPARERLMPGARPGLLARGPITRFRELRAELDRILYEQIRGRRAAAGGEPRDALAMMLAARDEAGKPLSDEELRDELVTLLTAGHETTATALAWALERLARHPGCLARLRAELEAGDERYLDAVVKETLRSRPVVIDAPRLLDAPLRLNGYEVPPRWYVAPAIPLVHAHPAAFPDADAFRPERFLDGGADLQAWIPFGGGMRRCLGSHLALVEMRAVIAEVVRRLEIAPASPAPERQAIRHVTLVPARGARLRLRPAQAASGLATGAPVSSRPARSSRTLAR